MLCLVRSLNQKEGITVGWVLHDLNQAAGYSDRLIFFKQGQIIASCSPAEVMTSEIVREVFGVEMTIISHPVNGVPICLF